LDADLVYCYHGTWAQLIFAWTKIAWGEAKAYGQHPTSVVDARILDD